MTTTLQLVTRIPITMSVYCRRQQIMYFINILTPRTLSSHFRSANRSSRHHSRRQRPPLPMAIYPNYSPLAGCVASPSRSALAFAFASCRSFASTSAGPRARRRPVAAAFFSLLGMSDAEIDALARRIVASVRYYLSSPELITLHLSFMIAVIVLK